MITCLNMHCVGCGVSEMLVVCGLWSLLFVFLCMVQGRIQGEGGPGGQDPPFSGTPKLHKEGKGRTRANGLHFST